MSAPNKPQSMAPGENKPTDRAHPVSYPVRLDLLKMIPYVQGALQREMRPHIDALGLVALPVEQNGTTLTYFATSPSQLSDLVLRFRKAAGGLPPPATEPPPKKCVVEPLYHLLSASVASLYAAFGHEMVTIIAPNDTRYSAAVNKLESIVDEFDVWPAERVVDTIRGRIGQPAEDRTYLWLQDYYEAEPSQALCHLVMLFGWWFESKAGGRWVIAGVGAPPSENRNQQGPEKLPNSLEVFQHVLAQKRWKLGLAPAVLASLSE